MQLIQAGLPTLLMIPSSRIGRHGRGESLG